MLFALAASILTGILAGVLPAIRAGRTDLNDALEGGRPQRCRQRRPSHAAAADRLRGGTFAGAADGRRRDDSQPAGAPERRRRVRSAQRADPAGGAARDAIQDAGCRRRRSSTGALQRLVRCRAAGSRRIDDLPLAGGSQQPIVVDGRAELLPRDQPTVAVRKITPGYLRAMRVPLLRGRDFAADDVNVMLVSRAAAKLLWGDVNPIGRQARLPLESKTVVKTIVGVVGDIREAGFSENPVATVYESTPRARLEPPRARRPHVGASAHARAGRHRRHPCDRFRTASRRNADDGGRARRHADVAAVQRAAPRLVRRGGPDARLGRHLQRVVVHRPRPKPRDRDPGGVGREAGGRGPAGRSSKA